MGHFGPKMAPPHNSGLALRVFNICTMNGANSNCLGQMGHSDAEWRILPRNTGSAVRIVLQFFTMKVVKKLY